MYYTYRNPGNYVTINNITIPKPILIHSGTVASSH
jgi:hypothetical protein